MLATTITARHCEIPAELRQRADEVCRRLGGQATRPLEAHVTFDVDGLEKTAELRLHSARGDVFVAHGEAAGRPCFADELDEWSRDVGQEGAWPEGGDGLAEAVAHGDGVVIGDGVEEAVDR